MLGAVDNIKHSKAARQGTVKLQHSIYIHLNIKSSEKINRFIRPHKLTQ